MEHVAKALKKSPEDVKKANLYQNGQVCLWQFIVILRLLLWSLLVKIVSCPCTKLSHLYWYSGPDPRSLVKVTGVELVNDEVVLVKFDS